ncbi:MAG TPA: hypothetical protein VGC90_07405 [Candidatus Limnocylindrales bacterium]|jgi:hypothetical protein
MVTMDCPWCNEPIRLEATDAAIRCDECRVEVEFAADEAAAEIARAA